MNNIFTRVYLGDGVYVQYEDSGLIKLSTHNGIKETNIVYFEQETLRAFQDYTIELMKEILRLKSERQNTRD